MVFKKGMKAWNKGKTGVYSEEAKRKMSEAMKGRKPWNTGKSHSKITKRKISKAMKSRRNQKNL